MKNAQEFVNNLLTIAGININGSNPCDIKVLDPKFYQAVIKQGSLGVGEAYMNGWWDSAALDQTVAKVLEAKLETRIKSSDLLFLYFKSKFFNMQSKVHALRVAQQHYDLSNAFYAKMLDPWMQYTSANYSKADNLNQAQENKLDQICKKLQLKPGDHVLELGCGFGGFAKFAAERYGCRVTGYNISKEQVSWARNWTQGLPVEIRQQDYRTATGTYDKALAIGLLEHVGYKNYRTLMQTAYNCLKPNGLFILNNVGGNYSNVTTDPWLEKYIFPGSVMPSPAQFGKAIENLFVLENWENNGLDYDRTCMDWFENFNRNWSEFKDKYDEKFYRMWKYYLLLCAGSFRARKNQNWEVLISKL